MNQPTDECTNKCASCHLILIPRAHVPGNVQGPWHHLYILRRHFSCSHCALCHLGHLCHSVVLHSNSCHHHCLQYHWSIFGLGWHPHGPGHECHDGDPLVQGDPSPTVDASSLFPLRLLSGQPLVLRGAGRLPVANDPRPRGLSRMCGCGGRSQRVGHHFHQHGALGGAHCLHSTCLQVKPEMSSCSFFLEETPSSCCHWHFFRHDQRTPP